MAALKALLEDAETNAILCIQAPVAIVSSEQVAEACSPLLREPRKTVLSCWLGVDAVASARDIFSDAGIPTYDTPEDAVDAFMRMVSYRRNQELLMETPASSPVEFTPESGTVREAIVKVLGAGRDLLTEPESKAVLAAYGIPVVGVTAVEIIGDRAIALPPLNTNLAWELVSRTRVAKLLAGYRDRPAANRDAIYIVLMGVAQLVADIPEIQELDINPLLADEHGVIAVDARISVKATTVKGPERLTIRPNPRELEDEEPRLGCGRFDRRPVDVL